MLLEEGRIAGGSLWRAEDSGAVVRRVTYATPAVGAAMVVVSLLAGDWRDAAGVVAGVVLAMINFRSLGNSLRSILAAGHERAPSGTTMMFVFRWIIVATIAFALTTTGLASIVGVFVGMFSPAAAIGLEAVYQAAHALRGGANDDQN
jgi:hypothetical protein